MEKVKKGWKVYCPLCTKAGEKGKEVLTWSTQSFGYVRKVSSFRKRFTEAKEVVTGRLYAHLLENHVDTILEVWINNQSSQEHLWEEIEQKDR